MLYNVDYRAAEGMRPEVVSIVGYNSEDDAAKAPLAEGAVRLQARGPADLDSASVEVRLALWHFKAAPGQATPDDGCTGQNVWNLLAPPAKPKRQPRAEYQKETPEREAEMIAANQRPPYMTVKAFRAARKALALASKENPEKELTAPSGSPTTAPPDGAAPSEPEQESDMKAKSKAKKATATKVPGMPREGTKKAKLLAAAQKAGGITKAEGQKITGWQQFRGTLGELATAAKMKVVIHTDPDGKKATRWEVKK